MKIYQFLFIGLLSLSACSVGYDPQEKLSADSTRIADSIAYSHTLESLLNVPNHEELERLYGKSAVSFDTIWGAEGFFSMGTILKTEPESHIEIAWQNEKLKAVIISVTLVSDQDWYSSEITNGKWHSSRGVNLGMTMEELEKANGRPFTFSGFGWDYAGSILDWQKGNLDGKGIAVQLSEGEADSTLSETESATVLGDVEVQSDNPVARKFHPRVWAISVAK